MVNATVLVNILAYILFLSNSMENSGNIDTMARGMPVKIENLRWFLILNLNLLHPQIRICQTTSFLWQVNVFVELYILKD